MAFGDVLAGWAEAHHTHTQNLLKMDYENRRSIAEQYAKMAESGKYDEASSQQFYKNALQLMSLEPGKKPPKELMPDENGMFSMKVQPPAPPPVHIPETPFSPNMPIQTAFPGPGGDIERTVAMLTGGSTMKAPPNEDTVIPRRDIQAPAPPPHELMEMMPYKQQLQRTREKTAATMKPTPIKQEWISEPDEKGDSYKMLTVNQLNPVTGEMEQYVQKSLTPVRKFAPRAFARGAININDAVSSLSQGIALSLDEPTLDELKAIQAAEPNATLIPTGSGQFYIAPRGYKPTTIGNRRYLVPDVASMGVSPYGEDAPIFDVGIDRPEVATTRQTPLPGIRTATGDVAVATTQATRTPAAPGMTGFPSQTLPGVGLPAPLAPPAVPPNLAPAGIPPAAPAIQPPPVTPPPPAAQAAPVTSIPGIPAATYQYYERSTSALNEIAKTLSFDREHPVRDTLDSPEFASIVADRNVRQKMAKVFQLLQALPQERDAQKPEFGLSIPGLLHLNNLGDYLSNKTGFTKELADARAKMVQDAMEDLSRTSPAAIRLLNTIQSMYASMPGLRSVTQGGAYAQAMRNLERDIPTMLNTVSLADYYNKIAQISRDISTTTTNPDVRKIMTGNPAWAAMPVEWQEMTDHYFAIAKLIERDPAGFTTLTDGASLGLVPGKWYYFPNGQRGRPPVPVVAPVPPRRGP